MSELQKAEMLKETIKQTFEANVEETELLVTADGNCFLAKDKNHAELHARNTKQKVETVKREDYVDETPTDVTNTDVTNTSATKKTKSKTK